jgi:hypothetical protein
VHLLAPAGLLLAVGIVPVLAAFARGERRAGRARSLLGLRPPRRFRRRAAAVALCTAAGLLALAASRPVVRTAHTRFVRTDAQAMFVLDISRSMLAAASPSGASRLARAKEAAKDLRAAIPDVPAGVASFTDRTLPNLFPTPDEGVFAATIDRSVAVERPPPGGSSLQATTFDALATLAGGGYFTPGRRRRVLVVLTDAESRDFNTSLLRATLGRSPGVHTILVRVGSSRDRVFGSDGLPEADYRPEQTAPTIGRFVKTTGARAVDGSRLGQAEAAVKSAVGRGPRVRVGTSSADTPLAPYLVLVAFAPLGVLLRLRNVL